MPKRSIILAGLLAMLVLALASCGGGGDGDEDEISEVITASATEPNPADCTELQTLRFTEQNEFAKGPQAIRSCIEEELDTSNDPAAVEVSEIAVDDSDATADVTFAGGIFDRQTVTVSLVEREGQWKVDRIEEFVEFDQQSLAAALLKTATSGADPLPQERAECISQQVASAPADALQDALLGGDRARLEAFFGGC
jgi:hypothetical protein